MKSVIYSQNLNIGKSTKLNCATIRNMCRAYQYYCTVKSGACEDPGKSEQFKYSYPFFKPESCMIQLVLMQQSLNSTKKNTG